MMRSKVAEEVRSEQMQSIAALPLEQRFARVREATELAIRMYMAGRGVDRDTAIREIRLQRQEGRRYSRCIQSRT